jgi:hypothetical protein
MDEEKNKQTEAIPEVVTQFLERLNRRLGHEDGFKTVYANNFNFEPSVWDLKMRFGELNQKKAGEFIIDWHTAVTIPWLQAKFVAYFLLLNFAWYEHRNGRLSVPPGVVPAPPEAPSGEHASDPTAVQWYETSKKLYAEFFGA